VILVLAAGLSLSLWITREAVIVLGRNAERWLNQLTDWIHRRGPLARIGRELRRPAEPEPPALVSLGFMLSIFRRPDHRLVWVSVPARRRSICIPTMRCDLPRSVEHPLAAAGAAGPAIRSLREFSRACCS